MWEFLRLRSRQVPIRDGRTPAGNGLGGRAATKANLFSFILLGREFPTCEESRRWQEYEVYMNAWLQKRKRRSFAKNTGTGAGASV